MGAVQASEGGKAVPGDRSLQEAGLGREGPWGVQVGWRVLPWID